MTVNNNVLEIKLHSTHLELSVEINGYKVVTHCYSANMKSAAGSIMLAQPLAGSYRIKGRLQGLIFPSLCIQMPMNKTDKVLDFCFSSISKTLFRGKFWTNHIRNLTSPKRSRMFTNLQWQLLLNLHQPQSINCECVVSTCVYILSGKESHATQFSRQKRVYGEDHRLGAHAEVQFLQTSPERWLFNTVAYLCFVRSG